MSALEALSERIQSAPAVLQDRTLNRDVARALGWGYQTPSEGGRRHPSWFHPDDCRNGVPVLDSLHGTDVWREPSDYLGSLDAAATLVPADCKFTLDGHHNRASVYRYWQPSHADDDGCAVYSAEAASLARALTAACLLAKAEDA